MPRAKGTPHRLCRQLRLERAKTGWSLANVSRRIGLSEVVIGSYERGDRNPTLDRLDQVAGLYGLEVGLVPKGSYGKRVLDRATLDAVMKVCRNLKMSDLVPNEGEQ